MMSLLITENLTVGIGKRILIESLNWRVQQGEFWCILGRNGSGKSSLLYTLSGLLPRRDGQIFLGHKELRQMGANELARYRGLVQQVQTDAFQHSVLDAVTAGRTPYEPLTMAVVAGIRTMTSRSLMPLWRHLAYCLCDMPM